MILASLVRAYDRLSPHGEVPEFGYARTEIGFCIVLTVNGRPAFKPIDFRQRKGKRYIGRALDVPTPLVQRTSDIAPNFLWDKAAYSLGLVSGSGRRTSDEHRAFVEFHRAALNDIDDLGASALREFLEWWSPSSISSSGWSAEMKDHNIIFALESEYRTNLLHDRAVLKDRWSSLYTARAATVSRCLLTGESGRIARSHPPIKRVRGTQTSGAFIVSYNSAAFTSYNHKEGDNAPISENAAFKYTATLNAFLNYGSNNVLQIGDTSTVFWADAAEASLAVEAEAIFGHLFGAIDENVEVEKIGGKLRQIVRGVPLDEIEPRLSRGVRFHVLGLAPNKARISVRYWFEDDFGQLTARYQQYANDIRIEPWPKHRPALKIASAVLRTAPARRDRAGMVKFDKKQVSPLLSGELLRSILSGARFPGALLGLLLTRVRSDGLIDGVRVALMKAIIVRNMRHENRLPMGENNQQMKEYLVRSDPNDPNPARRLGRLFALIERAQLAALGVEINVTVKDKYLGAAAATPRQVMSKLVVNSEEHHLKRLRNGHSDATWIKDSNHARAVGAALSRDIGRLWAAFSNGLPAQHSNEEQGLFLVGYYQERYGSMGREEDVSPDDDVEVDASDHNEE